MASKFYMKSKHEFHFWDFMAAGRKPQVWQYRLSARMSHFTLGMLWGLLAISREGILKLEQ
jgi:hypothetical protein